MEAGIRKQNREPIQNVINFVKIFVCVTRLKMHQNILNNTTTIVIRLQMAACTGPISRRVKSDVGAASVIGVAHGQIAPHLIVTKMTVHRMFHLGQHGPNLMFGPIFAPCQK